MEFKDVNGTGDSSVMSKYELHLHPLAEKDFIGSIKIELDLKKKPEQQNVIQTVVILDRSGSMGHAARRLTNEIIPMALSMLSYKKLQTIHLITFDSLSQLYTVTVERMKSLPIRAQGGTNMAPAIRKIQILFETFQSDKPIRVLTISDGQVGDRQETEKAAAGLVEFLKDREFTINSQAVRFFTSETQPDTKALCSLLQINNTTTSQLIDIPAEEENEIIAEQIASLFMSDNLCDGQTLSTDSEIILKFPWETSTSQLTLVPGENVFWLKEIPSDEIKIGEEPINIVTETPLTLPKFQALMEGKLFYIVDHMKVLKVVGTEEANNKIEKMVKYFQNTENDLEDSFNNEVKATQRKIADILTVIADDKTVTNLNSAQKAEYLRESSLLTEQPIEEQAEISTNFTNTKTDYAISERDIIFLVLSFFLAMIVIKYF
ncbi:CLUMA_CG008366, isoform A [Clunio marinus]|uniref:CLUMA_CG008366, isoform A n=1 Tax=Clunio marinus TaxID=568069 RepID=A0A1J1I541_9DIPT|nr:CLUMA_CG008366, isoform A [Clunio marinus]